MTNVETHPEFHDTVEGLKRGDFSRLAPLFHDSPGGGSCRIVAWFAEGYFESEPEALAEALACACFNGRTDVVRFLLDRGVDPTAGKGTGMNAFHWAANRGHLDTVQLLIERKAPLEAENAYGGTILGATVWAAINEPKPMHRAIIEELLAAGARIERAGYPTGHADIDELLRRHGAGA
jgi:hypothetical protein